MGKSVEEVIDMIGSIRLEDAMMVLQRRKLAAERAEEEQDVRETVRTLFGDPYRQGVVSGSASNAVGDATRAAVEAIAEGLAHTSEAGIDPIPIPTGLEPARLRDDAPFGAATVYRGGTALAYGTNMDRVSRVTVDGEEVPAVVVGSDRIEFGVPEDASDGCVEIFSELDTWGARADHAQAVPARRKRGELMFRQLAAALAAPNPPIPPSAGRSSSTFTRCSCRGISRSSGRCSRPRTSCPRRAGSGSPAPFCLRSARPESRFRRQRSCGIT